MFDRLRAFGKAHPFISSILDGVQYFFDFSYGRSLDLFVPPLDGVYLI